MASTMTTCLVFVWAFGRKKILVIQKLRGMGKDKWNFPGGKALPGELLVETAKRELFEEAGLTLSDRERSGVQIQKVGEIHFHFDPPENSNEKSENWSNQCHLFSVDLPDESLPDVAAQDPLECKPFWTDFDMMPWDKFWPVDKVWVPQVQRGEKIAYDIFFDSKGALQAFKEKTKEYTDGYVFTSFDDFT